MTRFQLWEAGKPVSILVVDQNTIVEGNPPDFLLRSLENCILDKVRTKEEYLHYHCRSMGNVMNLHNDGTGMTILEAETGSDKG